MSKQHHHILRAWPTANDEERHNLPSARQLFKSLVVEDADIVPCESVLTSWPPPNPLDVPSREVIGVITKHAKPATINSVQTIALDWSGFCDVVRLWHITGGYIPSSRDFLLSTIAETGVSSTIALASTQAAALACAAAAGQAGVWRKLAALGGVGALVTVTLFDASCVQPLFQPKKREEMPATNSVRQMLFACTSASAGLLLAPTVPVISGTVGDPKTKGYGPIAVAGVSLAHAFVNATLLASLPRQRALDSPVRARLSLCLTSATAGLVTAATASCLAHRVGRKDAASPIMMAAGLVTLHVAAVTCAAMGAYERGVPESLTAPLLPLKYLIAAAAWAFSKDFAER